MKKPILIIMAAGLGSRYGGLKQIDYVDSEGHVLMDYSIYDAYCSGFETIICVITKKIEKDFKELFSGRISKHLIIKYAYQDINNIPKGFSVPGRRIKPWGTAHAVLSAKELIDGPFAVINADDYYGKSAFETIFNFLLNNADKRHNAMIGYRIDNTLTESGYVSRGICETDTNGILTGITERTHIEKRPEGIAFTEDGVHFTFIPEGTIVSMNMWGFGEEMMDEIDNKFVTFLNENLHKNPLNCEYFLPWVLGKLIKENKIEVRVLDTCDKWYGVTYASDINNVRDALAELRSEGKYPRYF